MKKVLEVFRDAYVRRAPGQKTANVVSELFRGQSTYDVTRLDGTLDQQRREILFWRSRDVPAKRLSFDEAKPRIKEAYYLAKASQLA